MDRAMIKRHLAQAERHVLEGERHVARQRQIAASLVEHEVSARLARDLLAQFEKLLALHVADRDRLRAQLANL
jgi:hypothetical protein